MHRFLARFRQGTCPCTEAVVGNTASASLPPMPPLRRTTTIRTATSLPPMPPLRRTTTIRTATSLREAADNARACDDPTACREALARILSLLEEQTSAAAAGVEMTERTRLSLQHVYAHQPLAAAKTMENILVKPPNDFLCAISREMMSDPVLCSDGHTYEHASIKEAFKHSTRSPLTRAELETHSSGILKTTENVALRGAIARWRADRGLIPLPPPARPPPSSSLDSFTTFATSSGGGGGAAAARYGEIERAHPGGQIVEAKELEAAAYMYRGKLEAQSQNWPEGVSYTRKALAVREEMRDTLDAATLRTIRRHRGDGHYATTAKLMLLETVWLLGAQLEHLGDPADFDEAVALLRRAKEGFATELGEGANNAISLKATQQCAFILMKKGELDEAETLLRDALTGYEANVATHSNETRIILATNARGQLGTLLMLRPEQQAEGTAMVRLALAALSSLGAAGDSRGDKMIVRLRTALAEAG